MGCNAGKDLVKGAVRTLSNIYGRVFQDGQKQPFAKLQDSIPPENQKFSWGIEACNFIKKRLQHRCFPANIVKFLRTAFLIEHLRRLLLDEDQDKAKTEITLRHRYLTGSPPFLENLLTWQESERPVKFVSKMYLLPEITFLYLVLPLCSILYQWQVINVYGEYTTVHFRTEFGRGLT